MIQLAHRHDQVHRGEHEDLAGQAEQRAGVILLQFERLAEQRLGFLGVETFEQEAAEGALRTSDELVAAAEKLGLDPILACSIIDIGVSPSEFPS